MIRIGETTISADTSEELREAVIYRVEGLKKIRKKCEDETLPAGVDEADSKIDCLRDLLRLMSPDGQTDAIAQATRGNGQAEVFESVEATAEDRPAPTEPAPVVDVAAVKAALILSQLCGEVSDEAFDELDVVEEDDPRRPRPPARCPPVPAPSRPVLPLSPPRSRRHSGERHPRACGAGLCRRAVDGGGLHAGGIRPPCSRAPRAAAASYTTALPTAS